MERTLRGHIPNSNPSVERIHIRVDKYTIEQLDECKELLNTTRSDIIRKGIAMVYDTLKK